jgi:hypothetical protein
VLLGCRRGRAHADGPCKRAFCWADSGEEEKQQPELQFLFFFFKNVK